MTSPHHGARWSGRGKRSVQVGDVEPAVEPTEETPPTEPTPEPPPEPQPETPVERPVEPEQPQLPTEPLATDAARTYAAMNGVDLATVTGTGAEGRITKDDVAASISPPSE